MKMSHEEIKKLIMNCDQEKLNESAIESLLKYLPSAEQVCDTPTLYSSIWGNLSWWGISPCFRRNLLDVFWGNVLGVFWGNVLGVFWGMSWVSFGECPGCLFGESPCLEILPFWGISSWLFIIQIVIVVAFFDAPNWYVINACSNLF